jgi:hypothetical protein
VTHDAFVVAANRDQSEGLVQICLAMSFRRNRCAVLVAVEAQPARFF